MQFCENCRFVFEGNRCPICDSKKSRPVQDDDFCFLTEKSAAYSAALTEIFRENDIPCSALSHTRGIETYFALPPENNDSMCRFFPRKSKSFPEENGERGNGSMERVFAAKRRQSSRLAKI